MPYITTTDGQAVEMPQLMQRPDGTPSKTGIRLVPSKAVDGGMQPVATTVAQAAELAEILDAVPLPPARKLMMDAVKTQLAKQENDAALRGVLREETSFQTGTVQNDGTELPRSTSAEQEHERVLRAREVARSLGYDDLVRDVRFDRQLPGMGGFGRPDSAATQIYGSVIPGYSVVAGLGTLAERFVYGGEIAALEVVLQLDLNERAQVKRELDLIDVNRARLRQDAADAYAASPAGQIAALRAELAAFKASVAPPAPSGTLDDRMAALAAQGITVEVQPA